MPDRSIPKSDSLAAEEGRDRAPSGTWLTPDPGPHPAKLLREQLDAGLDMVVPGVFNGLSALLARQAGARALYLSGAAFSASMGMPDVGLVTLDELARAARQIVRVTRLPLMVDAGAGFGSALNVMRTVRELEGARCAGIQLADQVDPEAFAEKVAAARSAAQALVVIARTDARATHGFDEAVRRGLAYRQGGADVIFPEALETEDEFAAYAREVPGALLASMTEFAKGPMLTAARMFELGYRLVVFPVSAASVAAKQVEAFYRDLMRTGTQAPWLERMLTREELYRLIGYDDYAGLDRSLRRVEPPG